MLCFILDGHKNSLPCRPKSARFVSRKKNPAIRYISDLENFVLDKNIEGIKSMSDAIDNEFFLYMKFVILFYADVTVIMTETAEDFQNGLNELYLYCSKWKFQVNTENTNILFFLKALCQPNVFYLTNIILCK